MHFLSPFLKTATILVFFQYVGNLPSLIDLQYIIYKGFTNVDAVLLINIGGMLSGPGPFFVSRDFNLLNISFSLMLIVDKDELLLIPESKLDTLFKELSYSTHCLEK